MKQVAKDLTLIQTHLSNIPFVIEKLQSNQNKDQTLQKQIHYVEELVDKIGSIKASTKFDGQKMLVY